MFSRATDDRNSSPAIATSKSSRPGQDYSPLPNSNKTRGTLVTPLTYTSEQCCAFVTSGAVAHTSEASSPQQNSHSLEDPAKLPISGTHSALQDNLVSDASVCPVPDAPKLDSGSLASSAAAHTTQISATKQDSPFLRLPVELRMVIYDLAIQDNLDNPGTVATVEPMGRTTLGDKLIVERPPFVPFTGALALLQTNQKLRREGFDIFRRLAGAKLQKLHEALELYLASVSPKDNDDERNRLRDLVDVALKLMCLVLDLNCPLGSQPGSQWCTGMDRWCKLEHSKKLVEAKGTYLRATPRVQALFKDVIAGCEGDDRWEALVKCYDEDYERRKAEAQSDGAKPKVNKQSL